MVTQNSVARVDEVVLVDQEVGVVTRTSRNALGLIGPRAGSPTRGEAIVKPATSVWKTCPRRGVGELVEIGRDDGDVRCRRGHGRGADDRAQGVARHEAGVGAAGSAETRLTKGRSVTLSV